MNQQVITSGLTLKCFTKYFSLVVILFFASTMFSVAQNNCNINLRAENNRTIKTIRSSEYTYTLYLENLDQVSHNIVLSGYNHNEGCENPGQLQMDSKVSLSIFLLDQDSNIISDIFQLGAGQKIKFYLKLVVPENTPFESWNCTEVLVEAVNCEPVTLELYTFNPHPENLE